MGCVWRVLEFVYVLGYPVFWLVVSILTFRDMFRMKFGDAEQEAAPVSFAVHKIAPSKGSVEDLSKTKLST